MQIRNIVRLAVWGWLLTIPIAGATGQGEKSMDEVSPAVRNAVEPFIATGEISGAVTLVAHKGKTVSFEAMGVSNLETRRPMRRDDIFWIASMTKPMVGVAAMILADEGKLNINDDVERYLPEFKDLWMVAEKSDSVMKLRRPSRNITLLDVATHTAGIGGVEEPHPHTTLAELVAMASQRPLEFEPGSRWKYSTTGTHVLGRVVEVVSGQRFEVFLQERLFDPLGMKDTTFFPLKEDVKRIAKSYVKDKNKPKLEETKVYFVKGELWDTKRTVKPGGGLFSTAEDLRRFYQMMLNKGVWEGKRILSETAVRELTRTQSGEIKTGFTTGMSWGIKFQVVKEPQGVTAMLNPGTFGHGGAYATQSWADPVNHTIYILMIQRRGFKNGDNSPIRRAFQAAAARALNNNIEKQPSYISLFNGRNLDGWVIENNGTFSVQEEKILVNRGTGWLRSQESFGDFVLELDFRFLEKEANSGIFIRTGPTSKTDENGWPDNGYQVQCMDTISGPHPLATMIPYGAPPFEHESDLDALAEAYHPTGQWNRYQITCAGETLQVKLNGALITTATKIKNLRGHIGIQGENGLLEFRNIRIRHLD